MPSPVQISAWPELMRAETAAACLDVSKSFFLRQVAPELQAVQLSPGVVGYLRTDLVAWLHAKAGRQAATPAGDPFAGADPFS